MDANPVSEKRKRVFSSLIHTTIGIFTGSNGSDGHGAILDSTCTRSPEATLRLPESPRKRPRPRFPDPAISGVDVLLNDGVKDLRSRRVFSPSSELSKEIIGRKLGAEFDCDESEDDARTAKKEGLESIDEKNATESEQNGEVDQGFECEAQKFKNGSRGSEMIEGLNGEPVRTAPHDAKMSADSGVGEKFGNGVEGFVENPSNGNSQRIESDSKTKVFLKPCSRRKVFRTPGSFSYRRMLPYLMDISKENSCELEINQRPKLKTGLEVKKPQAAKASESEEASKDNIEKGRVSMECLQNGDSEQMTALDCATESFNSHKIKLASSEKVTELPSPSMTEAEKSWSKSLGNGHIQNYKLRLPKEDQKSTNFERQIPIVVEDFQCEKDNVIHISCDDGKLVDNLDNVDSGEIDSRFPCKVQDGDLSNTSLSSTPDGFNLGKGNELGQCSEDSRQPGCEWMKGLDVMRPLEDQKLNQLNDQSVGNDCEVVKQVNHPNEESIQMTPPDAEIFGKQEVEGNSIDREDYVLRSKDHYLGNLSDGINHINAILDYNTRHNSSSKCKGVLKPRSQLKLFRSPGSFSYRRLLPYLMDIAKDNSDASVNGHGAKPERDLEQPSPCTSNNPGIPLDKSNGFGFKENQKKDSAALPPTALTAVNDSSNYEPNLISPEPSSEIKTCHSQKEESESLQVNEIVSDGQSELETSHDLLSLTQDSELGTSHDLVSSPQDTGGCPVVSLFSSNCESSSKDELEMSNGNHLCVETKGYSQRLAMESSDVVKSVEADSYFYTPSQHGVLVSSEIPAVGLKKGILKKNPRGCRGLCTCLNCASFRLHAERAFEFSRNQMEDAQEVVSELIKELSFLRNVLEKSTEDADDRIAVQASQVKEACRKASEAEELAKNRIGEMNYDLNIHCRITGLERPRVRFANGVKGNVIPKANFPSEQVSMQEEDGQTELHFAN
ncbi:hypothetical protein PanWU01x14_186580 [Parasponia andersonii]|uniref:Uncharacterized protein n=1 Tax=Parasponia andersonii TaxID=3476 RepID=A0A2P5C3U8_PARAD|nr:hypothetical protein PanWU01x14_186580 [Parasponia andersonii]